MVRVKVPATTANIGPGFDCLGIAIDIYNTIEVEEYGEELYIKVVGEGCNEVPCDQTNLVYSSMQKVFDVVGYRPKGIRMTLINEIPVARGLGSSAACIVGGMVAANALTGFRLGLHELLKLAVQADGHPDNVVPALVGGMTAACLEGEEVLYVKMDPPPGIKLAVMIPDFELSTVQARQVLPDAIPVKDAVFNISRTAILVASFLTGRSEMLAVATQDRLHQPYRKALIPHWDDIFFYAGKWGAKGVFLSGSGPALVAILDEGNVTFIDRMKEAVSAFQERWEIRMVDFCRNGAEVSRI
ncbi:MAG: homoserine kinase [Caldicoprobacter oshimai]|uniref:Homoserine kinase n=1 Tax=Caldicoprobacter faecalis TaxID=937334 RepID=A0A1I5TUB7_9FIRM|nr:homoserine kinase [Caldicoprobacter faecalis]PZN12029.1 MAG: homoserine kinase [Caldicoprobacter oshimai]SFP86644.1 homoserine kinase [Caldicoprobacter faecalis]